MISSEENGGFFVEDEIIEKKEVKEDPSVLLPINLKEACFYCHSFPIDQEVMKIFKRPVCYGCNRTKLKFITKTTCKDEFLLNDEELKQFSYLTRPNPHRGTWNDMQLYLEDEIKKFSFEKYGDEEQILKMKIEKKAKSKNVKLQKIKNKVKELKRKTFLQPTEAKHVHKFVKISEKYSKCSCGMRIEEEEL